MTARTEYTIIDHSPPEYAFRIRGFRYCNILHGADIYQAKCATLIERRSLVDDSTREEP